MKNLLQSSLKMVLFSAIFLTGAFNIFAQNWNQIIKVTAQNNGGSSARSPADFYGRSVSISGNYAIVGANYESEDANGLNTLATAGAAYILYNNAGNWVQVKKITAPVRKSADEFGLSVSISGEYAIVGAYTEDENALEANTLEGSGSAYIFKKDQGGTDNWGLVKKITASTRAIGDRFGYSVSISGNYAIVGAFQDGEDAQEINTLFGSGSAYIFKKDHGGADNWGQAKKICAQIRAMGDYFGYSVSISGDYAIVGALFEDDDANELNTLISSGSAYIFKKDQGGTDNWGQVKKITATSRQDNDGFGLPVSIGGDYVIVASYGEDEDASEANTLSASGSAYIFKKDQGGADNWGLVKKITASSRSISDFFGISLSINGEYAIVGALQEDEDANELNTLISSGSAYIFKKDQGGTDNWGQVQKITASVRAIGDFFGVSVAMDGDDVIVGAYGESEDASEANTLAGSGSAYFFHHSQPLPVMLTTLEAVKIENQALMTWTTTMESNSDYFEIQKGVNGLSWKTLGRVPAAANSNQHRSYSFMDYNPLEENSSGHEILYRLKMVDLDGSFAYSRIVSLSFGNSQQTILYPNPVSDRLFCTPSNAGKIESISLINNSGQVMFRSTDANKSAIPTYQLTPGIYTAQIKEKQGTIQFQKVVVIK